MDIQKILVSILLPACVVLVLFGIQKAKKKEDDRMRNKKSNESFTVEIPSEVILIGAISVFLMSTVLLCFTFLSEEPPHWIMYATFGLFIWLGMHLIIKTLTFRVIVEGDSITVFSAFKKPYTFTFYEIVSAVRQVKKNQMKSERIVIKTTDRKKVIVESSEIAYERFAEEIQKKVGREYLTGF